VGISPVSFSPSQLKVSSKLKPSLTHTKLCSMTQSIIIKVILYTPWRRMG
jgi:hypothetical protein